MKVIELKNYEVVFEFENEDHGNFKIQKVVFIIFEQRRFDLFGLLY